MWTSRLEILKKIWSLTEPFSNNLHGFGLTFDVFSRKKSTKHNKMENLWNILVLIFHVFFGFIFYHPGFYSSLSDKKQRNGSISKNVIILVDFEEKNLPKMLNRWSKNRFCIHFWQIVTKKTHQSFTWLVITVLIRNFLGPRDPINPSKHERAHPSLDHALAPSYYRNQSIFTNGQKRFCTSWKPKKLSKTIPLKVNGYV